MVDVLGTRLGRYEIRERLGKGGMAAVYKAWDTNLDRWVAVKVLHDYLAEETDFKERFVREAKVVASLNHSNIVQVYDFDTIERDGEPIYYMVMAYIPGKSLKAIMDERHAAGDHLRLTEIANVMRGVSGALNYAHAQGMVHRDVTPGNILFNDDGQAVLADFGLARLVSGARLTQTGMTSGTPMYMPPEQGMGGHVDNRSDIYSLGVILFEMVAGRAPYSGDSAVAIIMKHINEPVPPLLSSDGTLNPGMEAVVSKAMSKDPADRYQDVASMQDDFNNAITNKTTIAALEGVKAHSKPPGTIVLPAPAPVTNNTRPKWLIPAIVIVLIILAAGVFIVVKHNNDVQSAAVIASDQASLLSPPGSAMTDGGNAVDPSMTSGPLIFKDDFGPNRGELAWPVTTDNPQVYRNIENGVYHLKNMLPSTALPTVFDTDHQYANNFQFEGDFKLSDQSQSDSAAGIIFRYSKDDEYYVFAVNGQGQVSIWLRSASAWTELRNTSMHWTPADGVFPKGQVNHLKLVDTGTEFIGYVNGKQVIDVEVKPVVPVGAIGIYLATTSSQKVTAPLAEVEVDNFSVAYYVTATPVPLTLPTDSGATGSATAAATSAQ